MEPRFEVRIRNAVNYGIPPKIEGGEISIRAEEDNDILRLEIADTGLGFHEGTDPGTGLNNIRKRLQSLDGNKGRLILEMTQYPASKP